MKPHYEIALVLAGGVVTLQIIDLARYYAKPDAPSLPLASIYVSTSAPADTGSAWPIFDTIADQIVAMPPLKLPDVGQSDT